MLANNINSLLNERLQKKKKNSESVAYMQHLLNQLPDEKAEQLAFEIIGNLQQEVMNYKLKK